MSDEFRFNLIATDGKARRGEITMPRGTVRTPAFMPVGTAGTVKAMYLDQVRELVNPHVMFVGGVFESGN